MADVPAVNGEAPDWRTAIRRYLVAIAIGNLVWETAQLPLYTIWRTGTAAELAFAVFHCTLGDVVIATVALVGALLLCGSAAWPVARFVHVAITAVAGGIAYTVYSEHVNTVLRKSWAYSDLMPTFSLIGTGLSPLAQWLVLPAVAFAISRRRT